MSPSSAGRADASPDPLIADLQAKLYPYRPRLTNWHFWAVQGLILVVAGVHSTVESLRILEQQPATHDNSLSFVPVALFFVPVVYAALNFGLGGSVATAAWCTMLTLPNVFIFHSGLQRVAELLQIGTVDAIAVFVGQRVDRELRARRRAEAAGAALMASEARYRSLFESSPVAVLVLDPAGAVLEANPAAGVLFGRKPSDLRGQPVADVVGPVAARLLTLSSPDDERRRTADIVLRARDGSRVCLEPTLTRIADDRGSPAVQVLLRDVTEERSRQVGLRAYAAHILSAQEEERKRIAQELHDETIQKLILLCRQLDLVEGSNAVSSQVADGLRQVRRSAEEIVGGLRGFARALRPPLLDDLGLVASIRRLLADLAERAGTEGQLEVIGEERRLSPDVELAVFRIAQESLRNVERHARATHVAVTLSLDEGGVRLEVADDGMGFALPPGLDLAASGHLGLLGMRERAESLGGRLEIQSSPGRGTTAIVSIPERADLSEAAKPCLPPR